MITLPGISIGYGSRTLVKDVSFTLAPGELVLLCGPNGSGKTSLLREIARRYPVECAMVPTRIPKLKGFTARDFLRNSLFDRPHSSLEVIDQALEALGLEAFATRDISTLSDGEFQKLCIASGLVRRPSCLLLDEPTAFLDAENRILVVDCLRSLTRDSLGNPLAAHDQTALPGSGQTGRPSPLTILFSSHDLHESAPRASRIFAIGPDGSFHTGGVEVIREAFPNLPPVSTFGEVVISEGGTSPKQGHGRTLMEKFEAIKTQPLQKPSSEAHDKEEYE